MTDGLTSRLQRLNKQGRTTVLKFHFMEKDGHAHVDLNHVPLAPGQQSDFDVYPTPPQVRTIGPQAPVGTYDYNVTIDGTVSAFGKPPGSDPVIIIHPPNE